MRTRTKKLRKIRVKNVLFLLLIIGFLGGSCFFISRNLSKNKNLKEENKVIEDKEIVDFKNMTLKEVEEYVKTKKIDLETDYEYSEDFKENVVISSNLVNNKLSIIVSKGKIPTEKFQKLKVDELGKVPIMMYHGIVDTKAEYTGGNVDKDGYTRTSEAFLKDLEFYYEKGYRMVRLSDYIAGKIETPLGYSPIILTFDDGNANNFKVIGRDANGNLEFDPKSAIGILETIKKKYPDFSVTATFFLNSSLCNQKEYNEEIIKWLIKNGYDVGNHTTTHPDFTKITPLKSEEVVGKMYEELEKIIPGEYLKIVALPFGSPYKKNHANFSHIIKSEYNGKTYETEALLRVGWESEYSPFDKNFDKTFLKRCRAYDNNGSDFDIEMNFKLLDEKRFISDGDSNIITIPESKTANLVATDKKIITYKEAE